MRTTFVRLAGLALTILLSGPSAWPQASPSQRALTALELYYRCFTHITQTPPSATDPGLVSLKAMPNPQPTDAVNACMTVLSYGNFSSTTNQVPAGSNQATGYAVLNTFNDWFHTWFPNDQMITSTPDGTYVWTRAISDEGEMGLYLTRSLFAPGASYKDVVTGKDAMNAIRQSGPVTPSLDLTIGTGPYAPLANPFTVSNWGVQTGSLLGVEYMASDANRIALSLNPTGTISPTNPVIYPTRNLGYQSGGGVIGSLSYLLLNQGQGLNTTMDGGLIQSRRWAEAVFSNLLCRNLPVLRQEDVISLNMTQPASIPATGITPPFRSGTTCMACHAGIDSMAATVRNQMYVKSSLDSATHLQVFTASKAAEAPQAKGPNWEDSTGWVYVDQDPQYYLRPTNGMLRFRSYDSSTLVLSTVTNVATLGTAIAATNDYYVCATSKFFQFFTGLPVNLEDTGDPNNQALGYQDLYYRNLVISIAQQWQALIPQGFTTPPLRLSDLIQLIISNPLYQTQSMRYMGPLGGS